MSNGNKIFIINGSGGVGKDTFVNMVNLYTPSVSISSVEIIKEIAKKFFNWDGVKTEKSRKLLSDLKILATEYDDIPFKYLIKRANEYYNTSIFLHIREPEEIEKAKKFFNGETILIVNNNITQIKTNMADDNVYDYSYDYIVENNGDLKLLESTAKFFYENVICKNGKGEE